VSVVRAPTLLIGVEDFGEAAIGRLDAEVRALGEVPVRGIVARSAESADALKERLHGIIDDLLRTRLERVGVGRLDVVVLGDLAGAHADRVSVVLDCVSEVLVGFRRALPMPDRPEQRTVSMVAVLGAPALLTVDDMRPLKAIEDWHAGAATKALSRVFVLGRQHTGGTLDDEDVLRGAVLLATSTWLAGLRDSDHVSELLQHRAEGALFSLFNVAAADVPVDSIVQYCAWRSALAGAETLHARCAVDPGGALDMAAGRLDHGSWVSGLQAGEAARKARTLDSGSLMAVPPSVPDRFGWAEPVESIRTALTPLFSHVREPVRGSSPSVDEDTLMALDRAELAQLEDAGARIDAYLREELAPEHGARHLTRAAAVLDSVEQALMPMAERTVQGWGSARVEEPLPPPDRTPAEEALARRVEPLPAVLTAITLAGLAALVAGATVVAIQAAPGAAPTAGPAAGVTITKAATAGTATAPWGLTAACAISALLVGGGWLVARLREQATALSEAVSGLKESAARRRRAPTRGGSGAALALRERRLARAVLQRVVAARQRVAGLRGAISDLRDRARRELRGLGYVAAEGDRPADASAVLGPESPLHRHLLGADGLERLWVATRVTAEDDTWATALLQAAWPEAGVSTDLPFPPGGRWETEALVAQHGSLLATSVFGWAEVRREVADRLRSFLVQAVDPAVVGLAVEPAGQDGAPLASNQRAAVLVVAPSSAQGLLASVGDVRFPYDLAPAAVQSSRVVVLRAHPGCSAAELAWGTQQVRS